MNYLSRLYGYDDLSALGSGAQDGNALAGWNSGLNPQMTRPVRSSFPDPADYADEPRSQLGQAIVDYRARKRDDTGAMLASGAANLATMPLQMMTLEGMYGLGKSAYDAVATPYRVLTSPEPVSTEQMIEPAANIALTAPMGGAVAGRMAPGVAREAVAYSNSKEASLPGLLSQGGEKPKSLMDRLAAAKPETTYYRGVQNTDYPFPIDPSHLVSLPCHWIRENAIRRNRG